MKKIAIFLNFNHHPGGAERRFARYFSSTKSDELFIIINNNGRKKLNALSIPLESEKTIEFNSKTNELNSLNKLRALYSLWNIVRLHKISHIHYPIDPSFFTFIHSIIGKLTNVTYSISMVDSSRKSKSDISTVQYYFWKRSLINATRVDILSESILNNIKNIFKYTPKYEITACSFTDYSKSKINKIKDFDIVLMSRFVHGKGFDLFFSALDELTKNGKSSLIGKIGIFGDGPLKSKIEENIKNHPEFTFELSYTTDPFDIFSKSRIFLSLQEKENYPSQSILEALSCGAFIVATDVGETYKIVPKNVGIMVPNDAKALAEAIETAVSSHKNGAFSSEIPQNFVKENFSIEKFSKYFNNFLNKAIHEIR